MDDDTATGTAIANATPIAFADDSETQDVAALLAAAVKAISDEGAKTVAARDKPLFFPNGIELILLQFKIGEKVQITLKISGGACCKDSGANAAQTEEPIEIAAG
jgi:hypothetical protein